MRNIEKIASQLRNNAFEFSGERGIAPPKGKGKTGHRPMVIAPIENRIVRRAILDVLQGFSDKKHQHLGVQAVRSIMETPTSIGGVAHRGVPDGLRIIVDAIEGGNSFFARSDISNFFTRIPLKPIKNFISKSVGDDKFANLFECALETNLANRDELEERNLFKLFPDPEIGVAQGSALSALAGNIILSEFDKKFNERGIICVRYIDDFIIIGNSQKNVQKAFDSAQKTLLQLNMQVYQLDDVSAIESGKAHSGNIWDGTDILGYHVKGRSLRPSNKAQINIIDKIREITLDSQKEMKKSAYGRPSDSRKLFYETMARINRTARGWSQAFKHSTDRQALANIDTKIDRIINNFEFFAKSMVIKAGKDGRRRVLGVHLVQSVADIQLPKNREK